MEKRLKKVKKLVREIVKTRPTGQVIHYQVYISPNVETNIHINFRMKLGFRTELRRIIVSEKIGLESPALEIAIITLLTRNE